MNDKNQNILNLGSCNSFANTACFHGGNIAGTTAKFVVDGIAAVVVGDNHVTGDKGRTVLTIRWHEDV